MVETRIGYIQEGRTGALSLQGFKLRKTNMDRIVEDSIRSLGDTGKVRVVFSSRLDDPVVWLDHERLVKSLVDIETNAMEAMRDGGILSIDLEDTVEDISIVIRDTGPGISKEHMDLLFTPFFTTKAVGEGTGLSIPAAYALVKALGGAMTIESNASPEEGPTGTIVTITLPRRVIRPDMSQRLILHDKD